MKTKNDTINAIQTMVDSAVSKAGYDKTRNAMVVARNSNNTYEIEMDSIRYSNVVLYGSGVLQTNEIVKVVIPNNQASQMYILGKGVIEGRKRGSVNGLNSNAFGRETIASGYYSHAEGLETIASGNYSHAEGCETTASNYGSHAEGTETMASGSDSHAEGMYSTASGNQSHAEGYDTTASDDFCHAEGYDSTASGYCSHAEGWGTIASGESSHAQGIYNVANSSYIDIVGNGTAEEARSNAYALDWRGNGYYKGDVYVRCKADSSDGEKLIPNNFLEVYGSNGAATTRTISIAGTFYSPHTQGNWNYRSKNGVGTHPSWASLREPNPVYDTGIVVIEEAGWYKIDYEVYFYNGFTAGDRIGAGILKNYDIPEGHIGSSNEWIAYGRVQNANAYHTLSGSCMVNCAINDELRLAGQNITAGRGTISMSQVSKMIITKI